MIAKGIPSGRRALRRAACIGLAALLAGTMTAAAATSWRGRPARVKSVMFGYAAEPLAADGLRPLERTFLGKAAELSREQMQLARVAVGRAASSDVRAYAQQLVSDHRQINDSVEALRRRKGALLEEKGDEVVPTDARGLEEKSGEDFDREFIRLVAGRAADALALFEGVIIEATDPDVRDLIGLYLPMLREHQNRITELRKALP